MEHNFCPYCMSPAEAAKPCEVCGLTRGSYTPASHHLPPGTVLKERYLVGRALGEGGFGITYIGCDLQLELKVAIKEFFPVSKVSRVSRASLDVISYTSAARADYERGLDKFLQEARIIARMDKQPVIVNVRDFFEANCTAYIVMEYVDGTTFRELTEQQGGRIAAGELLPLIEPLFFALKEMHSNGLIHRDISPDNLMIEKGEVRLLDFGCARESDSGSTLTVALKHGYAPVEQYQSKGQGPWTDVYALAATIYYCLTGRKPPQAVDRFVEDELVPPRKLGIDLPQRQEQALMRAMSLPPKRRFQSMEEFHAALYQDFPPVPAAAPDAEEATVREGESTETVEAGQSEPSVSFSPPARRRRGRLLAGGIVGALALAVLLAALPGALGREQAESLGSGYRTQSPPGTESADAAGSSVSVSSTRGLLSLLEDDTVDSVTVPRDVWLDVDRPVTLTKSLRVEDGAGIGFHAGLTVALGGRLEVEGSVGGDALLRTVDGGTVLVGPGGHLDGGMFWLEREDDLICGSDGEVDIWGGVDPTKGTISDPWAQSHYLVLDEEALFAGAVRVTSEDEFIRYCQGERPIVIDGEITLTHFRETSVPILISEGATFSASFDGDYTLDLVRGGLLLNYGTIRGRISLLGSREEPADVCRFLNLGQAEVCLNSYNGPSTIFNQGKLTFSAGLTGEPVLDAASVSNVGQVTIGRGVSVAHQGNWSHNGGTVTVSGGSYTLSEGTGFINWEAVVLESGGRLVVDTDDLHDQGVLTVSSDSVIGGSCQIRHGFD